jgi:hypothetical protein
MPGFVKIGCSRHPVQRTAELGATSGVPTPFVLEFFQYVLEMQFVEQTLHRMLTRFRVTPDREFFRIGLDEAVHIFSEWILAARLLPVQGEDFVVEGEGIAPLHLGALPLVGKVDKELSPEVRFLIVRGQGQEAWKQRVEDHKRLFERFSDSEGSVQ